VSATIARPISACARAWRRSIIREKASTTAIGLDEAGINDDRDMLQELKLVLRAHRVPAWSRPTCRRCPRCCAWPPSAARDHAFGTTIARWRWQGGRHGAVDWDSIAYPYLDEETPLLDAVIQRAKPAGGHHDHV